jgi:hypothetical protein
MFEGLRRFILVPRIKALRGVEASFQDWLLRAAASRGKWRRWVVGIGVGLMLTIAWIIFWAIVEVTEWFEYSFSRIEIQDHIMEHAWYDFATVLFVGVPLLVVTPLLTYALLARRAARRALWKRHECPRCRHDVLGAPLASDASFTCSECGFSMLARPAWNDSHPRESLATFAPASELIRPLRSRRAVRMGAIGVGVMLVLGAAGAGGYAALREHRLRTWVREATAAPRHGLVIEAALLQAFPAPRDGIDPNLPSFWQELLTIRRDIDDAERVGRERDLPEDPESAASFYPEVAMVASWPLPDRLPESERAVRIAEHESALRTFQALAKTDLFARLDQLSDLSLRPVPGPTAHDGMPGWQFSSARSVVRLNSARAAFGLREGDADAALRAWRSSLHVARRIGEYPTALARLIGRSFYSLVLDEMRSALRARREPAFIDACAALLCEHAPDESMDAVLAVERGMLLDALADQFASDDPLNTEHLLLSPGDADARLGGFSENVEAINTLFADLADYAARPKWSDAPGRSLRGDPFTTKADQSLAFVRTSDLLDSVIVQSSFTLPIDRGGTLLMLAIERFRAREGRLPEALAELVPVDIAGLPVDPWSGKPLVYRVLRAEEPAANAAQGGEAWPYVLYSVGPDRTDNGGVFWAEGNPLASTVPPGTDSLVTVPSN